MGSLGFFGIRYPERYGGSDMDALATVVLAEELGRSTFSGVATTALVHSEMASIHLFRAGSEAQKDKWMPPIIAGEVITAVAVTEPDAGSDVKGDPHLRAPRGRQLRHRRRQNVHHQRRATPISISSRPKPIAAVSRAGRSPCSWSRKARPASPSAARSTSMAGARPIPPNCISTAAAFPRKTGSARRDVAFTPSCRISRTSGRRSAQRRSGKSQAAIDLTLDYVRTRKAFGAPLWERETIRQRLAMLAAKVEAGRQLVYHAAWLGRKASMPPRKCRW